MGPLIDEASVQRFTAAIEQATPTSPWQPISAPEIEALTLYRMPIAPAVSRKRRIPSSDASGMKEA